ncbi:YpoC family protein [Planococcus kocurii]|uniref:YpoC family protein n=1 Tax=Planococcus TaxID=1372 RepID=UPI0011EC673E|nr:hypothetical protein [Planococcus sp. ANT_H30]KAA0958179.1 hypothetical protein FQ085_00265 [Planococcus sp. ANT_H30]
MKSSQKLTKEQLEPYFLEWLRITTELANLHEQRSKQTKVTIQEGLELYQRLLSHCRDALQDDGFEPLNGLERLNFIKTSSRTYAAYRQLDELFTELKKILARKRIELKRLND